MLKDKFKQPKSVSQFHNNLKKYYVCLGDSLFINSNGDSDYYPMSLIKSFDDIYKITNSGFYGNGNSPSLTPKVSFDMINFSDFLYDNCNYNKGSIDFFTNSENYKVWESQNEFLSKGEPKWWSLDNQIMRPFYIFTLGKFSGYMMS